MSAIFASVIRRKMRRQHVTIRQLAKTMGLTMSRVREVRTYGTPPAWTNASEHCWKQDWLEGIDRAANDGSVPSHPVILSEDF